MLTHLTLINFALADHLALDIALVLASIAVIAGFVVDPKVWFMAAAIYAVFIAYFIFHSRHRLVQGTPEEEFESIRKAEKDL